MQFPRRKIARCWLVITWWMVTGYVFAQQANESKSRIFELEPFDQITLTQEAGGGTFKVRPLPFANRQIPRNPAPNTRVKVELLQPATKAEIAWREIAEVELFEQMVLAEADALVAAKQFDAAYDYFAFLRANYPKMPGLASSTQSYLYRNAGVLFQQGDLPPAFALLEELHEQDPSYNGLSGAMASVTDRLMNDYVREQKYVAARQLLQRASKRSGNDDRTVTTWRAKLLAAATSEIESARQQLAAKQYRQARDAALQAMDIWPPVDGASELLAKINALYPMVVVAVPQARPPHSVATPLHPTTMRRSELTARPLVQLYGYSSRGPEYRSAWGEMTLARDRGQVSFQMKRDTETATAMTGYDLANYIAATDSPRRFIRTVTVNRVFDARLDFVHSTVSPLSLLAQLTPSEAANGGPAAGEFAMEFAADEVRFAARDLATLGKDAMPREIVEVALADPLAEIEALRSGKVDVIARIAPGFLPMLSDDATIAVRRYAIPSVHLLVPNMKRPFPANRTFRRAIAYAIDRESVLRQDVLGGQTLSGCRTISAPFPAAENADDFWGYAYDNSIAPLPYEPGMGVTLSRVAADEVARAAALANREPPELAAITIGHEDDPLHRQATQAIVLRLNRLGLASRALPLTDGEAAAECDFVYAEMLMYEPIVDAAALLKQRELASSSGYLTLALRELATATNWREASDQLHKIHATLHAEQTVIPLWQLTDRFAIRKQLTGVSESPLTLYQNIGSWRIDTQTP